MARRVSSTGVVVEQKSTNVRRVSSVGLMVEYKGISGRRVASLGLLVEYKPKQLIALTSGIYSVEAFGGAILQPGPVTLAASSIAGVTAFGSPILRPIIAPSGIDSAERFGNTVIEDPNAKKDSKQSGRMTTIFMSGNIY
jgi:hypothetical protein